MVKLPQVIGLVLCEKLEVNSQTGQLSLVGIFQALGFPDFPAVLPQFTVYVALYGGAGEGTIELVIQRLETEADVYSYKKWLAFPNRWTYLHVEIPVTKCLFPAPGRYVLQLRFDGKDLSQRYLDIRSDRGEP